MAPFPLQDRLRQRGKRGRKPGLRLDGPKVAALIAARGYVPARVAEAAGCSHGHLSNIQSGRYPASSALRDRLAAVLEVDAGEITLAGQEAA